MKHITVFAIAGCLLASFAAAGTVSAQDHAAKATIPFNFNVGDKWVPAGRYSITSDMTNPKVIFIRSEDGKITRRSESTRNGCGRCGRRTRYVDASGPFHWYTKCGSGSLDVVATQWH